MNFVLHNLRLQELVAIVCENKLFYDDFVNFLKEEGYGTVLEFIREDSNEKASSTISKYLARTSEVKLYDGLLRPYANSKAKWYFLAWLLRDAGIISINGGDFRSFGNGSPLSLKRMKLRKSFTPKY